MMTDRLGTPARLHEGFQHFIDPRLVTGTEAAEEAKHVSIQPQADRQLRFPDVEYQIGRPARTLRFGCRSSDRLCLR
jgi:hypothetical protein